MRRLGRIRAAMARPFAGRAMPRPSLRRLSARQMAVVLVMVAVLSVGLVVAGVAAATFYGEYGFHPSSNAGTWASRELAYAPAGVCQTCHDAEHSRQATSQHHSIGCQSCHGALEAHATDPEVTELSLEAPEAGMCARCHAATGGRPVGFPQVDLSTHFRSGECRACHDAHSTAVVRPPEVSHPLANFPDCTTCHKPDGLKALPSGHEEADDQVCLGCHAAGADGLHGAGR